MKPNHTLIPVVLLMVICAFARLIPHIPNFTPVESLAIFGAAYLQKRQWAYILPLLLLYVSDFIINNTVARSFFQDQEGIIWFSTYMIYNAVAVGLIVLVSSNLLAKINIKNLTFSVIASSVIFFIITNFGAWADPKSIYSNDITGLMSSFTAGIPFFRATLMGNILFTIILFGSLEIFKYLAIKQKKLSKSNASLTLATEGPVMIQGLDFYMDGPFVVMTAHYLTKRGVCCKSNCRHCPYQTSELK